MHLLGAINSVSNCYTPPELATKGATYICPECLKPVFLKKGNIRVSHFAHKMSSDPCGYYNRPGESQMHKDAKHRLKAILKAGYTIDISYSCPAYKTKYLDHHIDYLKIKLFEGEDVILEHRDKYGKYVADVAIVKNGEPRVILEVLHTHATTTNVRPEPWYEIYSEHILDSNFPTDVTKSIHFQCARRRKGWNDSGNGVNDVCSVCLNSKYKIGAYDRPTMGYCPPLEEYRDNECICLDCKQTVKLLGQIFTHEKETSCTMYNYPNDRQKTKDLLLKLGKLLQTFEGALFYNKCNAIIKRDLRCHNLIDLGDIELLSDESKLKMSIKENSLTVLNKENEIVSTIVLCPVKNMPSAIEKNKYHIDENEILSQFECFYSKDHYNYIEFEGLEFSTCYKELYCEECILFTNNLSKISSVPILCDRTNMPLLAKTYGREKNWYQDSPCIKCGIFSYDPVFESGARQICRLCNITFKCIMKPCIQCKVVNYDPVIYHGYRSICRDCVIHLKEETINSKCLVICD